MFCLSPLACSSRAERQVEQLAFVLFIAELSLRAKPKAHPGIGGSLYIAFVEIRGHKFKHGKMPKYWMMIQHSRCRNVLSEIFSKVSTITTLFLTFFTFNPVVLVIHF